METINEGFYEILKEQFPGLFDLVAALVARGESPATIGAFCHRCACRRGAPVSSIPGLVEGAAYHMLRLKQANKQ